MIAGRLHEREGKGSPTSAAPSSLLSGKIERPSQR